jgi:hypothetical protein
MIAALQHTEQGNVQRIRGILGENNAMRVAAIVEEGSQQTPGFLDHSFRFHGKLVAGAARVNPEIPEEPVHGGVNHFRLGPAGRRVIEVVIVSHISKPLRVATSPIGFKSRQRESATTTL